MRKHDLKKNSFCDREKYSTSDKNPQLCAFERFHATESSQRSNVNKWSLSINFCKSSCHGFVQNVCPLNFAHDYGLLTLLHQITCLTIVGSSLKLNNCGRLSDFLKACFIFLVQLLVMVLLLFLQINSLRYTQIFSFVM